MPTIMRVVSYRSNERDVSVSCQTQVHHNFRRMNSFLLTSGGRVSRFSRVVVRCSPNDCASRHVNPVNAHDASAFMSFKRTKLVSRRAWIESNDGLHDC